MTPERINELSEMSFRISKRLHAIAEEELGKGTAKEASTLMLMIITRTLSGNLKAVASAMGPEVAIQWLEDIFSNLMVMADIPGLRMAVKSVTEEPKKKPVEICSGPGCTFKIGVGVVHGPRCPERNKQ